MFSTSLIQSLLQELHHEFSRWSDLSDVKGSTKSDATPVTEIDQGISDFFKSHPIAKGLNFYSEEEHGSLVFPALILDPLDGTEGLLKGRPESVVSAAWMHTAKLSEGFGLIMNPFTGMELTSHMKPVWRPKDQPGPYLGYVSRSEWKKGLFTNHSSDKFTLQPMGSSANKLALLAIGACDFVVSLKPKHIWDIAAGSILLHQRGFEFWCQGKRVESLDRKVFEAPLIWARPDFVSTLLSEFSP